MNYSAIKPVDVANGPGVRVSLFVSGCRNHCKGCFNQDTWDFHAGQRLTGHDIVDICTAMEPDYISGFSLLGGDPFEPENQAGCLAVLRYIKGAYPNKSIWCWTGYRLEDMLQGGKNFTDYSMEMLRYIDVLVDGPFIEEQKDLTLAYRGSRNQRVIPLFPYRTHDGNFLANWVSSVNYDCETYGNDLVGYLNPMKECR